MKPWSQTYFMCYKENITRILKSLHNYVAARTVIKDEKNQTAESNTEKKWLRKVFAPI